MKGGNINFIDCINDLQRFAIPVYQRNYNWKTEHCKRLYDDLVKIVRANKTSHFFGSLVVVNSTDCDMKTVHLLIDGQQRLTTVSLLFLAIHDLISKGELVPEDSSLAGNVRNFLIADEEAEKRRIRLKHIQRDQEAFECLFSNENEYIRESSITMNYTYFRERLQKREVSPEQLYDAVKKLEIICIKLESSDEPQLVFECLNSTGLELSEGDKIRNFILMGQPPEKQEQLYDKYWKQIEKCTNCDVSSFVRDYLSVKQHVKPSSKRIYTQFREYCEQTGISAEELLKDLFDYAKRYEILLKGKPHSKTDCKMNSETLINCIYRLNNLESTITRPFFLEVLRLFDENKVSIFDVEKIFELTESYLFRRFICEVPTNSLDKVFLALHREIMRYDGSEADYAAKFQYALMAKKEKTRFPDNDEFCTAFGNRPVYQQMNSKNKVYILERFENHGTKETKNIYDLCRKQTYSIEHIMPQTLRQDWKSELGENHDEIHKTWLHRLANLTLTAYNSEYSNRSFTEKKTMKNGFQSSGIRMNAYIAQYEKWGEEELKKRNEHLMEQAQKIWKFPQTDYQPPQKQMDSCTLTNYETVTGKEIVYFRFGDMEQPVSSWKEMYQSVLQILYEKDKSILIHAVHSDNKKFSKNPDESSKYVEIRDGIYAIIQTSTREKLSTLEKIFQIYGVPMDELVFYLREGSETPMIPRHERQLNYWKAALEEIHKAHGNGGPYTNVHAGSRHWINGFIGVRNIHINCVVLENGARVELYIERGEKDKNKEIFDKLKQKRVEIESALGIELKWARLDNKKASRIYHQLDNVNIKNEADWPQMIKFHAEWSKKFYEVLVPYLSNGLEGSGQ